MTLTFFVVGTPMPKAMTARAANGHVFNNRVLAEETLPAMIALVYELAGKVPAVK